MTKDADEVANDKAIARIQAIRYGHMDTLAKEPTAILWIQYLDMIRVLRNFFTAERLGNWYLHLEAVSEILPYLAASGHSLYTKSASIYLSSMANLPNDHPVVHQHFVEGLHVARRSDHAWAGLSTDVRGRPWRYSVIPSSPDFPTEYQIRRNSNPAGLPVFAAIWGPDFRASIIILTNMFKQIKQIRITMFKVYPSPANADL